MNSRTFQIAVSRNNDILVLTLSGTISEQNSAEMVRDIVDICLKNRPGRLLIDIKEVTGRIGTLETYLLMKDFPLDGKYIVPKIAVIENPENREHYHFHETEVRNRGLDIMFFEKMDDAVAWLNGSDKG